MGQEEYSEVYSKILSFISYKPRSKGEVVEKLRSYTDDTLLREKIISDLESNKYVNDEEYIKTYLYGLTKSKRPVSIQKIKETLIKHKIDIDKYSGLIDLPEDFEKDNCIKVAKIKLKSLANEKNKFIKIQKLKKYLYYKGYSLSIINFTVDFLL